MIASASELLSFFLIAVLQASSSRRFASFSLPVDEWMSDNAR